MTHFMTFTHAYSAPSGRFTVRTGRPGFAAAETSVSKIPRRWPHTVLSPFLAAFSLLLTPAVSFGQEVLQSPALQNMGATAAGPARGSVVSGTRMSTHSVPLLYRGGTFAVEPAEPEKEPRPEITLPKGAPPPSHPEGFNYQQDPSVAVPAVSVPPYILHSFQGIPQTPSIPPDPVIAAGPHHLIAAVNRSFWIFDKNGLPLDSIDAATWYSTTFPGAAPFDPRVLYDHFANRFLMLWHHQNAATRESYYLLSVSDEDNPLGSWTSWALSASLNGSTPSDTWADNGCLGFDQEAVYITSDQWGFSTGTFAYAKLRIIGKSQLLSGSSGPLAWTDFWGIRNAVGGLAFRLRPAVMHTEAEEYYLLEVPDFTLGTHVSLYRLVNPLSKQELSAFAIPVTAWARAHDAEQKGEGIPIDTRRSTLAGEVHYLNGSVYAAWPVANPLAPNNTCIRYVRISTVSDAAAEDVTFGAPGYWYLYPAVAVDAAANVSICFTRSGSTEYPGAYVTWRLVSDGPGLRPSVQLQPGWAHYEKLDEGGENRWGDYNAAVLDPADRSLFWLMGEYAEAPANTWGTWIAGMRLSAAPDARVVLQRRVVDFGRINVPHPGEPVDTLFLTLWNAGAVPLVLSGMSLAQSSFEVADPPAFPITLALGDSTRFAIVCIPAHEGMLLDTLQMSCNDPVEPEVKVVLRASARAITRAQGGILYGIRSGQSGSWLYRLDTLGTATAIGKLSVADLRSLTIDPADRVLYGTADDGHGTALVRLDAITGETFPCRLFGVPDISAVAFGPDGALYGGSRSGGFYRMSTSSSSATLLSQASGLSFSGLSFAPDSTLWASAGEPYGNDTVYTVNPATGQVTPAGPTGFVVRISSLAHNPQGTLLALVENALLRIDNATGRGDFITYFGIEGLHAIAMLPGYFSSADPGRQPGLPLKFALHQNYPNPFNPTTTISYELPERTPVFLRVFTLPGQEVATLVDGISGPGLHTVTFDGSGLSSGVYLVRLQAGSFNGLRKIVLIR